MPVSAQTLPPSSNSNNIATPSSSNSALKLSQNMGDSQEGQILASGNNVYVTWIEGPEDNQNVFFKKSTDNGATFGSTVNLSNMQGKVVLLKMIENENNIYVSWFERSANNYGRLLVKSTDNGATFGPITNLSDKIGQSNSTASIYEGVAISGNNVYVSWFNNTMGYINTSIFFSRSIDNGNTFSQIALKNSLYSFQGLPQVIANQNNVYIMWVERSSVWFSHSSDNGITVSTPIAVMTGISVYDSPQMSISGNNIMVSNGRMFTQSTDNGATFTNIILNNDIITHIGPEIQTLSSASGDQITASGNNLYDVWILTDSKKQNSTLFFKQSNDNGNTFKNSINLSTSGKYSYPQMMVYRNDLYVFWRDYSSTEQDIFMKASTDGGNTFGDSINLSNGLGDSYNPQMAVSGNNAYVIWLSGSSQVHSLFFQNVNNIPAQPIVTPPQSPTNLIATPTSSSEVDLSWLAPQNNGGLPITGYKIERNDGNGFNIISNSQTTTYRDVGMIPNSEHSYRVSAINSAGSSLPSNSAPVITPPSGPPNPNENGTTPTPVVNPYVPISLSTSLPSYNQGDVIVMSGHVRNLVSATLVTLRVFNSHNDLVSVNQISPSSDGSFTRTFLSGGPLWTNAGTYTIIAQYGSYANTTATFNFNGARIPSQNNVENTTQQSTPSLEELLKQRYEAARKLQEMLNGHKLENESQQIQHEREHNNYGIINPTQQDIQNINQAKTNQTIAAEVNFGGNQSQTTSIDNNVSVKTTQNTPDSLGVQVTATNQTGPKVIVFNLNATTINLQNLKDLGVMYDGKLIQPAPNMDAILHAKPTDNPSFAIVVTQSGIQVLVLVPHFSTHSITIMNMSKVIPAVPEFPFTAIVLMIATFSIVLIPKIRHR